MEEAGFDHCPAGQSVQPAEPREAEYCPPIHGKHEEAPTDGE